ncbi:MAG: protein-export chaperone SecB [Alphaproteobacteria bacterium]
MTETKKEENQEQAFGVIHQYTKDFSFENLIGAKEMLEEDFNPTGEIQLSVNVDEVSENVSEIVIKLKIEAKDEEKKKSVYILELEYAGLIHTEGFNEEEKVPLLMIEAPRLLFPFAREIVASATRDGGFMPLVLKPVDFLGLFMQQTAGDK